MKIFHAQSKIYQIMFAAGKTGYHQILDIAIKKPFANGTHNDIYPTRHERSGPMIQQEMDLEIIRI